MKVKFSEIVGVNSTQGCVEIFYRRKGSDESDYPDVIRISPSDNMVHLSFSFTGKDFQVKPGMIGANFAEIKYEFPES